ncbi:Proline dehydrogenase [Macrophomina phaseolina MS6]|uniref:Proline dehydrogenase n=1 Tax=Macrophomina phaseolina (strain MS6) TaxID=1126212 RepID=K2RP99_MACPH|nr:Proline dehydrogenase [Macrophomina phaseolina MS6]
MLTTLRHTRPLSLKSPVLAQRALLVSTRAIHHNAGFSTRSPVRTASLAMKPGSSVQESVQYASQHLSAQSASPTSAAPASPARTFDDASNAIAKLPTASLFRNLLIQNLSAYPIVLSFLLSLLKRHSDLFVRAPVLRHALQYFFYAHYCAGATGPEISRTVKSLQQIGIKGVILNYAKEVDTPGVAAETGNEKAGEAQKLHEQQVSQWLDGTLKTIEYAPAGDYVAIKFSGAGAKVVDMLEHNQQTPDALFGDALVQVCDAARSKNIKLLVDAEHASQQAAIDRWTMAMMARYNRGEDVVVYNTYQMYLKASTAVLDAHLARAAAEGFNFGAKLVRGAYLGSDPRHLIHDTKAATDAAYDAAAEKLATYHLSPDARIRVGIVLGSHNAASLRKVRALRHQQAQAGLPVANVVYSQLMGMADELSLSLTSADAELGLKEGDADVYKYVTWGTMQECILYLVRRAEENRDAVASARDSRAIFWRELKRRFLPFAG